MAMVRAVVAGWIDVERRPRTFRAGDDGRGDAIENRAEEGRHRSVQARARPQRRAQLAARRRSRQD